MKKEKNERIFLDYASITPVDSEVGKKTRAVQNEFWANPSSLHLEGENAKNILEEARTKVARVLHCRTNEIFFTSGGTESLNLAIRGIIQRYPLTFVPHIIVSTIEHPAVLEPIKFLLKNKEIEASFISPDKKGIINPEFIRKEMKKNTVLVVIQHANNEIGTIQPIREISKILKAPSQPLPDREGRRGEANFPYLLVDCCQSALYEDVSLEKLGADILVLDGIKLYGPRGAGILAVKRYVNISPIVFGGGQEEGLRSGTENVAAVAGLAKALEISVKMREKESTRLIKLRDYTIQKILREIPNSSLNGDLENRLPNNINICFSSQGDTLGKVPKVSPWDSEFLVIKLDTLGFAVSAASACHVLSQESGSHINKSLGKPECSDSSLRITLGRSTTKTDLDKFVSALKKIIK